MTQNFYSAGMLYTTKTLISIALISLSLNTVASENFSKNVVSFKEFSGQSPTLIAFSQGISNRDFSWAISASGADSATLSHLQYDDLEVQTSQIEINLDQLIGNTNSRWNSFGQFTFGEVESGNLYDSDFNGFNEHQINTQSLAALDGSKTYEFTLGMSKDISLDYDGSRSLEFGMQWLSDHYQQHSGRVSIRESETLAIPETIQGLNSEYTAHWVGPFIGLTEKIHTNKQQFSASIALHTSAYLAQGQWNLRQDLAQPKSFEHQAFSAGVQLQLQHSVHIFKNASIQQTLQFGHSTSFKGQDKLYKSDGSVAKTQLTEVERANMSYSLGMLWRL